MARKMNIPVEQSFASATETPASQQVAGNTIQNNSGPHETSNTCRNCGTILSMDTQFCPKCGTQTEKTAQQPSQIEPTTATTHHAPPIPSHTPQASSNNGGTSKWMIVALAVLLMGGGFWYLGGEKKNDTPSPQASNPSKPVAATSSANYNPQQSGTTSGNQPTTQPQYVNPTKYINLKDQYNQEISTLAADINNYLSSHANFQNDQTFLSRAEKISRHIYGTKEALRIANIKNVALKQKLSEVFEALQGRVDGLLDGIRTSKNGGDYTPGFQRGGDAFDRFEEADKALKQMIR